MFLVLKPLLQPKYLKQKNNADTTKIVKPNDLTYTKIDTYKNIFSCTIQEIILVGIWLLKTN